MTEIINGINKDASTAQETANGSVTQDAPTASVAVQDSVTTSLDRTDAPGNVSSERDGLRDQYAALNETQKVDLMIKLTNKVDSLDQSVNSLLRMQLKLLEEQSEPIHKRHKGNHDSAQDSDAEIEIQEEKDRSFLIKMVTKYVPDFSGMGQEDEAFEEYDKWHRGVIKYQDLGTSKKIDEKLIAEILGYSLIKEAAQVFGDNKGELNNVESVCELLLDHFHLRNNEFFIFEELFKLANVNDLDKLADRLKTLDSLAPPEFPRIVFSAVFVYALPAEIRNYVRPLHDSLTIPWRTWLTSARGYTKATGQNNPFIHARASKSKKNSFGNKSNKWSKSSRQKNDQNSFFKGGKKTACFKCGEEGHYQAACTKESKKISGFSNTLAQRTTLRAYLTKIQNKELVYSPLIKETKINDQNVFLNLDCGAQSSVIGSNLVRKLGLELHELDKELVVEGIDATEKPSVVTHKVVVRFMIDESKVELSCLVSDHDNLQDHVLLGLNFIFENMNVSLNWLKQAYSDNISIEDTKTGKDDSELDKKTIPKINLYRLNVKEEERELEAVNVSTLSVKKANKALRKLNDEEPVLLLLIRRTQVVDSKGTDELANQVRAEFSDVIRQELPLKVEYRGKIKHKIDVIHGSSPKYSRPYRMSEADQKELSRQIDELIEAGRIYPTTSPYGAPVLLVKKKDGSKRLCCDFRKLNEVTVKSRFPLPLIEELFDHLKGAKWFSSLDLIAGYHQIPIEEKDQHYTSFVTNNKQYAWSVLAFGLTSAPSTFQMVMNETLSDYIGKFVLVYLDDILIYSPTKEKHLFHLRLVLQKLREVKLYAKLSKCVLFTQKLKWLGHIIDKDGIHMDTNKVEAMMKWPSPKTPIEAKRFLGLASYMRKFVAHFSDIARPLHRYAARKEPWGTAQDIAFKELKVELSSNRVLQPFDGTKTIRVTTDASKEAIGAVMELVDENNKVIGPTGYMSKALTGYQLNWPIRDKELFAILVALKTWKHYLKGRQFQLHTDHKSLETVMRGENLSDRVQGWMSTLVDFDFKIKYIPGETNRADALSRISIQQLAVSSGLIEKNVLKGLTNDYKNDKECNRIIKILSGEEKCPKELSTKIKRFKLENSLLYFGYYGGLIDRLVIPYGERRFELLRMFHSTPVAGHPGIHRTFAKLRKHYYWMKMKFDIVKYINHCEECQKSKNSHQRPVGVYHPLQIPTRRFEAINIDFVSGMAPDGIYDQIIVITCRLTKWVIVKPLSKKASTLEIAQLLIDEVVFQYGVPRFIVSDRDPKFTNAIWEYFAKRLQIQTNMSTAYNPQSDGQVERVNLTLIEMLRTVTKNEGGWVKYLSGVVFGYNSTLQVSIGSTPFMALRGYEPRFEGMMNPMWDKPEYSIPTKGQTSRWSAYKGMEEWLQDMDSSLLVTREGVAESQLTQSIHYNKRHREIPKYKPGDKILIHKDAYAPKNSGRKFHYMWFGPFTIESLKGEQTVKISRGELHNNKKHNVFNIRAIKKFRKFESQFNKVTSATMKDLEKDASVINRITHLFKDSNGLEMALVMVDNSTELDLLKVSLWDLKRLLPVTRYNYLINKYYKNRSWLKKGPMARLLYKGDEM
ncbi:Gag-Pol polyprotein [Monosporozyma unispora]